VTAVVSAGALLSLTTVAGPLFVAAAGGDLFERFSTGGRLRPPSLTVTTDGYSSLSTVHYRDALLRSAVEPLTGPGVATALGEEVVIAFGDRGDSARLVTRSHAFDHIEVVEGSLDRTDAGGVWLADYTAERIGAGVGDEVRLDPGLGEPARSVPVAGIYRDLVDFPVTPFWAPLRELIYIKPGDDSRPPPPLLMDEATFFSLATEMQDDVTEFRWEFPLPRRERNLEQADAFADALYGLDLRLSDPTTQLGAAFVDATFDTPAHAWVEQTRDTVASISGPVTTLSYAGRAVAFAALAGAGLFAVRRRRTEFNVLLARGVSPWRLGIRTAVEMLVPSIIGGALGWGGAAWVVRMLGPDGILARPALQESATFAALTILAGLCAVAVAVASSARAMAAEITGRGVGLARRFAWEPLVLVLAAASFYEVVNRPDAVSTAADGSIELDALLLIFPLLFIAGSSGIVVRLLFRLLGRIRTAGSALPPALYLALRRVTHGSGSAKAFISVASIAFGVFVFAAVMSSSTEATAQQEAALTVGSDVSVNVALPPQLTEASFDHTTVVRLSSATVDDGGSGRVELLGVDPDTFADVAFWRAEFSDSDLDELLSRLRPSAGQEGVPVLVSGDALSGDSIFAASLDVPLTVVGRARALPGMLGANGVVIADLDVLEEAFDSEGRSLVSVAGGYDLWAKDASEQEVVSALEAERASVRESVSAEELRATPAYLALTWTFDFLEALGVITSVVVLVGALLFLQARQTRAEASYAISRRMGLSRDAHRASVGLEFLAMLVTSALVGAGLAIAGAAFIHGRMDLGDLDQVPLFLVPPMPLLVLAAVLTIFAGLCAFAVQRRADSADVSQVMRYDG
jgi:putative ABC transport system permease protein